MPKPKTQHVVPNPNGGWDVKAGGAQRPTKHHERKQEAIDHGKEIAQNQKAELYIHNKDGKISDKRSYGNDPCPPKDKK
ncbi:MAG TPA: DUF2188 domain-containing protein [Candidatus Syntrophosphaera sp.]|nr:DUF2188 domain-containing protein [Candidatus Syntrophosphaera sp.]